jgi:hypothetical protein
MKITRRGFLAGLLAVGATIALPVPVAQATPAQVDEAWKKLLKDPWYFEINEFGTILEQGGKEPEIRSDLFDVDLGSGPTPQSLVDEVDACYPLTSHFEQLAVAELEDVQSILEDSDDLTRAERKRLQHLAAVLGEDGDGWPEWVLLEGEAGLPRFVEEVRQWLAEPYDGNDVEWLPRKWGAQGQAMAFFESLPRKTLKALGVVIIEGEHPGSSYYAAEPRQPIEDANEMAAALELPFRFKAEGTANG